MNCGLYVKNETRTTRYAAEELAYYFKKMDCDTEISFVSSETQASISLIIKDELNEGLSDGSKDEKIEADIENGVGFIAGNNPRALLLAVYRTLNVLGCRFLRPGKDFEQIPEINVGKLCVKLEETPSFRHRGVCIEGADSLENIVDFIDWLPKMGYNSFFIQFENPYSFLKRWYEHEFNPYLEKEPFSIEIAKKMSDKIDDEIAKRDLLHHRVGHGWTSEVLGYSSRYGWEKGVELKEEYREYAAELNGERQLFQDAPILTSLCFANPAARDKMIDIIVEYARERKDVDYLHVWLSDAENNICECEACQKETVSDQYVKLLNRLDKKMEAAGLNMKICFLLYHELLFAPEVEEIENPNRYVMMFAPISRTFEKSYADVDYENSIQEAGRYVRNKVTLPNSLEENLSYLFAWKKVFDGDSFVYDYPLGRAHYGDMGYISISKVIYRDIQYLNQLGLNGYISCQELRASLPNNFPNYVMGKMLWDKNLDYDTVKEEYFTGAYGADKESAYRYLEQLSELSSCDYFNAIGKRIDGKQYYNYECIEAICKEYLPCIKRHLIDEKGIVKEFWRVLAYHREYCILMERGLACLCSGRKTEAQMHWEELLNYIRKNEISYQPYLDVYRVIEVAKNYAGFLLVE